MQVVPLHRDMDCNNIATALRNIADQIEAGDYEFAPDMAVLVVAQESDRKTLDGHILNYNWQSHGLGKCGYFASKGLLAAALARFECGGDD